ncbi:MAG TPA: NAD-dependent epimerase/dehydratase family protein [Candidatus Paceibacterota bacterium]|nr:NAD-dependent epimerase/dehydratase family protein [Candidatus Paceibacterota bacterium]
MQDRPQTIFILGGDGYLGWSLGLAFAYRTGLRVVLVDNLVKREWERSIGAKLLVPLGKPKDRIAAYERAFGKTNLMFEKTDLLDEKAIVRLIRKYRPFAIVNAAQQPSAPFSMKSAENAATTYVNNIVGHLNTAWAITETDRNILYVKLGSAGCYSGIDTNLVPLAKKDFEFDHEGVVRKVAQSWMPMAASDFYHQSKISDFLIDDLACEVWKLRIMTVQQATIFGATIEENRPEELHALSTRFNYDETFGTVVNRFVCQIAIGHPMTIYGDGAQRTGTISLPDTVDNFITFAHADVRPGEHAVVHNVTDRLSITEIAETLRDVSGFAKVAFISNPRKEAEGRLTKEVERHELLRPPRRVADELRALLEFTERYRDNIDPSLIMPKVRWDHGMPAAMPGAEQRAATQHQAPAISPAPAPRTAGVRPAGTGDLR